MRIMTSNIWGNYFGNPAAERIDAIEGVLKKYSADVIGIQEMCPDWYKNDLAGRLEEDYVFVGGFKGNHSPLFFKRDVFEIIDMGWLRYTGVQDISKSVTWAVLERKEDGKRIGVCNTHLWWKAGEEHEITRENNAKQLLGVMLDIKKKYDNIPVVAFGDFNSRANGKAMKYLNACGVFSAYESADEFSEMSSDHGDPKRDENGIYHGQKTTNDKTMSLDHIVSFKGELHINVHKVVEDQLALDASDHSPVYIDFEF